MKPALLLLALFALLRALDPVSIETLRLKYFDTIFYWGEMGASQNVAVWDIDEEALAEKGQWPWPRQAFAELNYSLKEQGAAAVVYVVLFSEVDRFGGDNAFALSMDDVPTFLSSVVTAEVLPQKGWPVSVATIGPVNESAPKYFGVLSNVPVLQEHAVGVGVVNAAPEVDGLVRRVPMLVDVAQTLYPALALDVLRGIAGDNNYIAKAGDAGMEAVRVPRFSTIQTDRLGRVWLNWNTTFNNTDLSDKIVFVGVTAAGVSPMVPTPAGPMHAHRVQANLFETLLQGTAPVRPDWSLGAELLAIIVLGIAVAVVAKYLPALWVAEAVVAFSVLTATLSLALYIHYNVLIDATAALVTVFFVGAAGIATRMVSEYQLKRQIRGQFGTYVSPDLVAQLENNPELLQLGGQTKIMTFLFCDIVGFTPISEKLQDRPEELVELINRLLTQLTECVLEQGGTVDKFMGDCIMAFWGAPIDCPDHAERALLTAQAMLQKLKHLNKQLSSEGLPELNVGIGINTGPCVVGNMGSETRFDYSVLGDAVNTASRLEGQTRNYAEWVLIGENTANTQPTWVQYVDDLTVKGKSEPLKVFTLKGA
jgi:adenylate cyclase